MKMNELWIAFAGSRLNSSVSLHHLDDSVMIKISIGGIIDTESAFVTNVILAAMDSGPYDYCLIDVQNLTFVDGISINEHAIECLIRLTGFAMNRGIKAFLVVDNGYVREVLADILRRHRGFSKLLIQSSQDFLGSELAQKA